MKRLLLVAALLALAACGRPAPPAPAWSIAVHGGAGVIERANMDAQTEAQYRAAMNAALERGETVLRAGGSSLDAVQAVISGMEDDPLFNAGRGAVFGADGKNHLDASIMDGRTRAAGAVADVTHTRHPIALARAVMEHSPHVFLVGEGAEAFGRAQGLEQAAPSFFFTERRWRQLVRELELRNLPAPQRPADAPAPQGRNDAAGDDHKFGTVGVVALDTHGNLAAGTSTGGTTAKLWGRVGDTPVIGAGTYAQNGVCAVSATGTGEFFIRVGVARDICARMELRHDSAENAARAVFSELDAIQGDGGVIVMDGHGRVAWVFNTPGMYRARVAAGERPVVQIFADER
ncbi:MAG TPA: isoaspartyl peptidase/L-asparaginase [Caulobacterales bacterium]|nr:isoaspartyl peptidase/L-asparaginase [Caulobacterales bacterium]